MKLCIETTKDMNNVFTFTDFTNPIGRGEVAHFIAELETCKTTLLELWEEMKYGESK